MKKNNSSINHETCKKCLFCGDVCPNLLIEKNNEDLIVFKPEFYDLCITCGHCMAVCPTDSIKIEGLEYGKDILNVEKTETEKFDFQELISSRRAIRQYKDKDVSKDLLEKITDAIAFAPVSFTPNNLEITIADSKKMISALSAIIDFYEKLVKMLDKKIPRFFVKKNVSEETFTTLTDDVYPIFKYKLSFIREQKIDPIFRKAPNVFIIHANKKVVNHTEDGIIALTYGILAAQNLGLGTCPVSLIPPAINKNKDLKKIFEIPEENEVISSFIVGYPKYKYKKIIKRKLKNLSFI